MKNKIFAFMLLAIFSFAVRPVHLPQSQTLSSSEMSMIQGGDCDTALLAIYAIQLSVLAVTPGGQALWFAVFALWTIEFAKCDFGGGGGGGGGGNGSQLSAADQECQDSGGYTSSTNENMYGAPCSQSNCSGGYCCHD